MSTICNANVQYQNSPADICHISYMPADVTFNLGHISPRFNPSSIILHDWG